MRIELNPNGKIARYLARIDRAECPANKQSLLTALPKIIEVNAKELFFATAGWHRPFGRRGVTLARHIASGLIAGGRGPQVIAIQDEDEGDGPSFRYGTGFLVEWDKYPTQEPITNGFIPCDRVFGRGDDKQTAESALIGVPYWVHTQQ